MRAGGDDQHLPLGVVRRIVDIDLQQEAVELGFGQGIGAFLLQRVLGREHVERLGQVIGVAGDRDLAFLHRLQQRRLGARAGAVDFVRHQQLAEHRALDEAEAAPAGLAFFEHFRADDVGRHQVGRALHALGIDARAPAQRVHQLGLGEAGDADQQDMAAGEDGDQRLFDRLLLAENNLAELPANQVDALAIAFDQAGEVSPARSPDLRCRPL